LINYSINDNRSFGWFSLAPDGKQSSQNASFILEYPSSGENVPDCVYAQGGVESKAVDGLGIALMLSAKMSGV